MKNKSKILIIFAVATVLIFSLSYCYKEKMFWFEQKSPRVLGISDVHPRLWLNAEKMTELRLKACRNIDGSVISGCTPDASWTTLINYANSNLGTVYETDNRALNPARLPNFALAYQITKNSVYARAAIDKMLYMWDRPYTGYTLDTWIEFDNWYTARFLVPASALVFDWAYDQMSESEKQRFISQLNTWASRLAVSPKPNWAWHDSSNNYWHGYMWALTSAGYALYGHNPSAITYLDYVKNTMIPEALKQVNDQTLAWPIGTGEHPAGRSKGGEWSEGNSYGTNIMEFFLQSLFAVKGAEDINYFSQTGFWAEYLRLMLYAQLPGSSTGTIIVAGDGGSVTPDKAVTRLAARALLLSEPSSALASYSEQLINNYSILSDHKYFINFVFYETSVAPLSYSGLTRDYFAEGMKIQAYRENWVGSSTWFYSRFNAHYSDHTYDGQGGHFSLWKNGWLIKDINAGGAYDATDIRHNVVYLPPDADKANGMLWDEPIILHRETTGNYIYYAGDATNVFSGPEVRCDWRTCNVKLNQRSFFYLKSGNYLLVYDRVATSSAADTKKWQIYFPGSPAISGSTASYYNGASKVFVKTLTPGEATRSASQSGDDWRYQVAYSSSQKENNFLHLIQSGDGNPAAMNTGDLVQSDRGQMLGSFINNQYVVLFSKNNTQITSDSFSVSTNQVVTHFITGLAPQTKYYFSGPGLCNSASTNAEGVLNFFTEGSGQVWFSTGNLNCATLPLIPPPDSFDDSEPEPEENAVCQEDWSCAGWSFCLNGARLRVCSDLNQCGTESYKPAVTVACSNPSSSGEPAAPGKRYLSVAPASPGGPHVKIYDQEFNLFGQFFAYDKNFRNGVNTAMGDVDGDGELELVTGTEGISAPHLRIFDLKGQLKYQFFGFPVSSRVGLTVAAGDVDADGIDEVIVAPQGRGGPQVRIFKYNAARRNFILFRQFFAFPNTMRLGLNLAVGDLDNNGKEEIIVAPKNNGGPQVRVFEYNSSSQAFGLKSQFFAYAANFRGGVNLATGDVDNDGIKDIITGPGPGGASHVRIFNMKGGVKHQYFAAALTFRGGIDVAAIDYDSDGADEIMTGTYSAGPPGVIGFQHSLTTKKFVQDIYFLAYPQAFLGGIRLDGY